MSCLNTVLLGEFLVGRLSWFGDQKGWSNLSPSDDINCGLS
jgi:hypothetical protein